VLQVPCQVQALRKRCQSAVPHSHLAAVPASEVAARWPVAVNLLAGSLLGAWAGASWAVRMRTATLYKVLATLMVLMSAALVVTHTTTLDALARGRGWR